MPLLPDDFVKFMTTMLEDKKVGDQCPQVTTYRKTDEVTLYDYPHHHLGGDTDFWSIEIKEVLKKNDWCDGFVAWMVFDDGDNDQVFLVIYDKRDTLKAYLSEKDLHNFEEVSLDHELPCLVADYSEPLDSH